VIDLSAMAEDGSLDLELGKRWEEVRRVVGRYFTTLIQANGWEFDDVLQDVALKLMRTQAGANPWQPGRGASWASRVWHTARCVIINRHSKEQRRSRHHGVAYLGVDTGETCDPAEVAYTHSPEDALVIWLDIYEEEQCEN